MVTKFMRANILIHVYRLPPTEAGFKRSALDTGKMRVFIARGRVFPNGGFGRQMGGVTEAGHSKLVITTSGETKTHLQGSHNKVGGHKKVALTR